MPSLPAQRHATSQVQRDLNTLIASLEGLVVDSTLQNASGEGVSVDVDGTVTIKLGDNAGVQRLSIVDVDNSEVVYFDSNGATNLNHDSLAGFVAAEHVALPNTIASVLSDHNLTAHSALGLISSSAQVDHDATTNFVAAKHIDWSATGAEDVHADRIAAGAVTQHVGALDHNNLLNTHNLSTDIDHDALTGFIANEHINWVEGGVSANLITTGLITGGNLHANGYIRGTGIAADSQISGQDVIDTLPDNAGAQMLRVKDSDENTVASINSDGRISGVRLTASTAATLDGEVTIHLGDDAGAKKLSLTDLYEVEQFSVNSDGNVYAKGALEVDGNAQLDGAQVTINGSLYTWDVAFLRAGVSAEDAFSVKLDDNAGVYAAYFKDSDGTIVAQIDSDGHVAAKGRVMSDLRLLLKEQGAAPTQTADYATIYALASDRKVYARLSDGSTVELGGGGGVSLPNTIANVLTDHDLAAHTALGLFDSSADVDHDQTANFVANEHIDWTNASANLKTTGSVRISDNYLYLRSGTDVDHYIRFQSANDRTRLASWTGWEWYSTQHARNAAWLTNAGDLSYYGSLKSYKNSTEYTGYAYVPLTTPLTSTDFNGDNYDTSNDDITVDTSVKFGAPPGIKAALVDLIFSPGSAGVEIGLGPNSTYWYNLSCRGQVAGVYASQQGIVNCDANGDFLFHTTGTANSVYIRIWGYFI